MSEPTSTLPSPKPAIKKSRPRPPAAPAADKPPRVEQAADPRDRDREAEILEAIDQIERARLDYIQDTGSVAAVWYASFALVIIVDAGRVPASCMPLLTDVEDIAKFLDNMLTNDPEVNWNSIPIENALCGKLDSLNSKAARITAPPEKFSMVEFVRERLQEKGFYGDVPVTIPQISRMTGLAESEIKAFKEDPASVNWEGKQLPATTETEAAKRAAAAKFNSGRGLSTFASKFIACGFSANPEE
jgi:hypothetical protein